MNRQRYEQVPQREEVIILDNIHNSAHYNYNSAIPNSVASSLHTPSICAPSIPSSPPPSFHTHSSPSTPRPTPSTLSNRTHAISNHSNPSYAELWGVAPSTIGGGETELGAGIGTSNDALATIAGLKQRVEWLEESIGRLLLEKDNPSYDPSRPTTADPFPRRSDNCCVTFTDAPVDLERALTSGNNQNCCVSFRKSSTATEALRRQKRRDKLIIAGVVAFAFTMMVTLIMSAGPWGTGPRPRGGMRDGE